MGMSSISKFLPVLSPTQNGRCDQTMLGRHSGSASCRQMLLPPQVSERLIMAGLAQHSVIVTQPAEWPPTLRTERTNPSTNTRGHTKHTSYTPPFYKDTFSSPASVAVHEASPHCVVAQHPITSHDEGKELVTIVVKLSGQSWRLFTFWSEVV